MKKTLAFLLAAVLLLSLAACSGNPATPDDSQTDPSSGVSGDPDVTDTPTAPDSTDASDATGTSGAAASTTAGGNASKTNATSGSTSTTKNNGLDIKPAEGTKSLLDGLDFGGKTFTFAYRTDIVPDADEKALIQKFSKKFNCKIKTSVVAFDSYMDSMSKKIVAGQPYDVVFLHGSHMPMVVVNKLLMPLDSYFTTKDMADVAHPEKGGIYKPLSEYFMGKDGKVYGVSGPTDINFSIGYYNKQAFKDAGLEDPYTLWTKGQWTWDKFEEMAKKYGNAAKDTYLTPNMSGLLLTTGKNYVSRTGTASYTVNLNDPIVFTALTRYQKWVVTDKILRPKNMPNTTYYSDFANGKYPMLAEASDNHIGQIKQLIAEAKSPAWKNGDLSLLGLVPMPQYKAGTKYIAADWPLALGASVGSKDARVAVAYMLYKSVRANRTYTDPYALTTEEQKVYDEVYSSCTQVYDYYGFRNSTTNAMQQLHNMRTEIAAGNDVKATLEKYQSLIEGMRDGVLKDWK